MDLRPGLSWAADGELAVLGRRGVSSGQVASRLLERRGGGAFAGIRLCQSGFFGGLGSEARQQNRDLLRCIWRSLPLFLSLRFGGAKRRTTHLRVSRGFV